MDNLVIAATERSPEVNFDFEGGQLSLKGESYPEDASSVFGPIFAALEQYLVQAEGKTVTFDFNLIYFNSSSAKALMNMFQILDDAADRRGVKVEVNWRYAEDDETMQEFGEDFSEDLEHLTFNLVPTKG
ncbi:MAG TPA: DUF1987 domain-containing protein [Magnetospirillum sp.]|jgi:hypothetical protein|nr:DUF1987 domain-containing protein [Magnetospirillum sp.]